MRNPLIITAFLLLSNCQQDAMNVTGPCNTLTTENTWPTINFKSNYTIQVPNDYTGDGMVGFEGYSFVKNSGNNEVHLSYSYCGPLHCNDFGDTLRNSFPAMLTIKDNAGNSITLNKVENFCQNSGVTGIFYYANTNVMVDGIAYWEGRLYWKDNGLMKQALKIEFYPAELDNVKRIIQTIKSK